LAGSPAKKAKLIEKPRAVKRNGLVFDIPKQGEQTSEAKSQKEPPFDNAQGRKQRIPRAKTKNDPKLVAAARELRDRWLEQVDGSPLVSQGKYEVSRQPGATSRNVNVKQTPLLEATERRVSRQRVWRFTPAIRPLRSSALNRVSPYLP
jgi:hypothetical protein